MRTTTYLAALFSLAVCVFGSGITAGVNNTLEKRYSGDAPCDIKISSSLKKQLLSYHNDARKISNADPLEWSDELYCAAQQWANRCVFEHSKTEGTGENIGCGYGNGYKPLSAVEDWWNEHSLYKSGDGYSEAAGHYTQVVWKSTSQLGCAVQTCSANQLGLGGSGGNEDAYFVVCQYKLPGNVQGSFSKEVSLPLANRDPTAETTSSTSSTGTTSSGSNQSTNNDNTPTGYGQSTNNDNTATGSNQSTNNEDNSTARKSHWSPHKKVKSSKKNKNKHSKHHSSPKSYSNQGNTVQGQGNSEDCEEGSDSGKTKDGNGSWSYSWKTWSSSSKRSPSADEPAAHYPAKRDSLSLLSKHRLHKRRRVASKQ